MVPSAVAAVRVDCRNVPQRSTVGVLHPRISRTALLFRLRANQCIYACGGPLRQACKALTLVLIGYTIGVGAALALTKKDRLAVADQERPIFGCQDMRRVGLRLMTAGVIVVLVLNVLGRGTTYGANQFQYGLPSILGPIATTSLMAGLITVTLAASHTAKPTHLRSLLRGRSGLR